MKKITRYHILIFLVLFANFVKNSTLAESIQGGVSFNVNSAREYLQEGQEDNIDISGPYQFQASNTEKIVYSYNNSGQVIGITVQYINEPTKAYIYNQTKKLIYVEKYDRPTNIYPHRGYRYDLSGKLNLTSLSISKNEHFRFSPDGKLIAHSINGIIYDEDGNIIGKGTK